MTRPSPGREREEGVAERAAPVRIARLADGDAGRLVDQLVALVLRSKSSWGYDEEFMTRFAATSLTRELVGERRTALVAYAAHRPVGLAVVDDEPTRAWLEDLWVEPEYFGRGVGRALFEGAVEVAREHGHGTLELESDPHAEGFYLALGAVRTGTRPSGLQAGRELPLLSYRVARA